MVRLVPLGFTVSTRRVEGPHGHGHIAGVGSDARVTGTNDAQLTTKSGNGRAAAAGHAFIAELVGIVKIRAAGALQQIAGGGGFVAQLSRSPRQDSPGQQAVVPAHDGMSRQVGVRHQRADTQATGGCWFDFVEANLTDVDDVRRGLQFPVSSNPAGWCHRPEISTPVSGLRQRLLRRAYERARR